MRLLRYLATFVVAFLCIGTYAQDEKRSFTHTVERGETIFSISKMYDVSEDDILKLNGRTDRKIFAGETLLIPNSGLFHTIAPGETLYQLSKTYGVTVDDICRKNPGLSAENFKAGQVIVIPQKAQASDATDTAPVHEQSVADDAAKPSGRVSRQPNAVDIALVMPMTKSGGEKKRIVEFYEGMLVGIYDGKQRGVSVNLDVFDLNAKPISVVLKDARLKEADLIIGPFDENEIHKLSEFSKQQSIPLLIPFTSDVDDVFGNPNLFQINTPQSYLYSDVYECFVEKFKDANVIFINDSKSNDKKAFIDGLQHELVKNGIKYGSVSKSELQSVKSLIVENRANVIVPNTGDNIFLSEIMPVLQNIVRSDEMLQLHLFGYPEWQTYTHDYLSEFYELDTYFFTSFYANMLSKESSLFANKYQSWYKKELMNTYPKYGMLGYDLINYFLPYLWKYGDDFYEHLNTLPFTPVQTGFKFERVNNWGGFLNRKVFFVHFSRDFGLSIVDFE